MRYVIDVPRRLVLTYGERVAEYQAALEHQDRLLSDPQFDPTFNQLFNLTMVEKVEMNSEQVRKLAERDVFAAGTRRAAVVNSPMLYGLVRMFVAYRQFHGGREIMDIFFQSWAAEAWLKRSKNYMTTKSELQRWFEEGVCQGATHMIVVCDTFQWEDYPVYVSEHQDVVTEVNKYVKDASYRVMEVYKLQLEMGVQLNYGRAFNL